MKAGAGAMSDGLDFNTRNIADFRANHGQVGGHFEGAPMVVVHTVGARSGQPRTNIMMYLADDGRYLIFPSNRGLDNNPAWYWNIKAHPDIRIEVGDDVINVRATELTGAERDEKYALQSERYPAFAEYQRMTSRVIPVIALTPIPRPTQQSGGSLIDFDALYRGESPAEGIAPAASPPWDTKEPSPSVVAWQTEGWVHGNVLDIGCGFGDNAVYLAQNGHPVTGLDISPTALVTAEHRAKDAGVAVTFAVADSTKLDGYADVFDTVIDLGLFHSLDDAGQRSYVAAAHRATRPGATLLLTCFSDANPVGDEWRPAVSADTLREVLGGAGWDVISLEPATVSGELDGVRIDMAFWNLRAQRRS